MFMSLKLEQIDKKLLNELQFNFPITANPFAVIGERLGIAEAEILRRIRLLKEQGIIRRIGPTFEGSKLGYVNALVAMRVSPERLDQAGEFVSHYNEVTHNYARDHVYNLWFTLTCESQARMDEIIKEIKGNNGCSDLEILPAGKKFKINARFEL